jgi:hypothetical protein
LPLPSNGDERERGTDPFYGDTDDDGIGDGVEVLAGTDPRDSGSISPGTDRHVWTSNVWPVTLALEHEIAR